MRLSILLFSLLFLFACGPGSQLATLQSAMEMQQTQSDRQKQELEQQLADQHAQAIAAIDEAEETAKSILVDLNAALHAEDVAAPQVAASSPRAVIHTVREEVPVYLSDGTMTADEERGLLSDVDAQKAQAERAVAQARAAQQNLQKMKQTLGLLQQKLNPPPLEQYGPTGLLSAFLTIIGFVVGRRWRQWRI